MQHPPTARTVRTIHHSAGRVLLALMALWLGATAAWAALPLAVDGDSLPSLAPMLETVQPAVVNISTRGRESVSRNPLLRDPFFRRFFDLPQSGPPGQRGQSLGSGVVVDAEQGFVVTNHHVIEDAEEITVTLFDGREFTAEVIGVDPDSDVAVVRIPAESLTAIRIGDSDKLRVGDFVVAIGNPFGLSQTVTSGIVSALGRSGLGIEGYEDFIQTDASINLGNSGGALVNLRGELVGVNTAILAPGGGNVGIGFAIPVNMARNLMHQLIEFGEVRRGRLGVYIQDAENGSQLSPGAGPGALVSRIVPDSPADRAGIRAGDVVVGFNGKPIGDAADLRNAVGLLRIGEDVVLEIDRDGSLRTIRARIGDQQPKEEATPWFIAKLEGAVLRDLEANEDSQTDGGVLVVDVVDASPAWRIGLRKDDIIVSVNRDRVRDLSQMRAALAGSEQGLLLSVRRQGALLHLVIR